MKLIHQLKVLLLVCVLCGCVEMRMAGADTFEPAVLFPSNSVHANTLPNGVQTLIRSTPGSQVVSLQVWVEAGSLYETQQTSGATHLIEMLAMQGSAKYPTQTAGRLSGPQATLENMGGQVGSFTARDDVFWSVTLAPSALDQAIKIMADAALQPDLSDPSVLAAKTVAAADWMSSRLDPVGYSSDLAYAEAFPKHPYGKPALGTLDSLKTLTGEMVRDYYKQRFTGSHLHVVVVGDVDVAATQYLLAQSFGKAPQTMTADAPIIEAKPLAGVHSVVRRGVLPIEIITLAWRSPAISNVTDTVATDVILTYLGEGSKAALRQVLQGDDDDAAGEEHHADDLAGGFSVDYLTQKDSGLFLISIIAPRDAAEATTAVQKLLREMSSGLSAEELQYAKTTLRRQYVFQSETSSGMAGALGFYDAIDSHQFAMDYLSEVENITQQDIARVMQKYFSGGNYVQVTLLPALGNPQQDNGSGIIASLGAKA